MSDLISRKDLIEYLKKVTVTEGITFNTGFKQVLSDIEMFPPARERRKFQGRVNSMERLTKKELTANNYVELKNAMM